mmetsp:Transcript_9419/g.23001  ORF Transcript_9419/g.23001 Transcript_9419/m.23001 type:complete len:98 (+) Transcript_9419:464-757(+)
MTTTMGADDGEEYRGREVCKDLRPRTDFSSSNDSDNDVGLIFGRELGMMTTTNDGVGIVDYWDKLIPDGPNPIQTRRKRSRRVAPSSHDGWAVPRDL